MKNVFTLMQVLSNLSYIPRTGGLYGGIPSGAVESIGAHSFKVSCICLVLGETANKNKVKIDIGRILKTALTHDWHESILLDIPTHSPSYMSYFSGEGMKVEVRNAEKNARKAIEEYVQDDCDLQLEADLPAVERELIVIADIVALMMEILEWKYNGLKYEWFDFLWVNTGARLQKKIDRFPFLQQLVIELQHGYDSGVKPANPFLTKPEFQTLKK